jgi:hypothetical protein
MRISTTFRNEKLLPTDFSAVVKHMGSIVSAIADTWPQFEKNKWRLAADSDDENESYQVFDGDEPSSAVIAVLTEEFRTSPDATYIVISSGDSLAAKGFTMVCHVGMPGSKNKFRIDTFGDFHLGDFSLVSRIVAQCASEFTPSYIGVYPIEYIEKQVFDDRPGVGWMLYLPRLITMVQVPEAHALIPVPEAGKTQSGTIVVSVTDAVFSDESPEHVAAANRIEMRLVDQDLLPTFRDL